MPANIAQGGSSQQRIADSVRQRIAVRMACRTYLEGDAHSTQNKLTSSDEAMQIVPKAGPNGSRKHGRRRRRLFLVFANKPG
jgi:hypothetical protein